MKIKDEQSHIKQSAASWDLYRPMIQQRLHSQFGLIIQDHELENLWRAVEQRMQFHQMDSAADYYNLLNQDHSEEWKGLINLITIKHTFFFRNQPQFISLGKTILPELIEHKKKSSPYKKPNLKIWSAGCSTGEEPYSIAMLLHHCLNLSDWNVEILATDISEQALYLARMGVYSENAIHSLDSLYSKRFFSRAQKTQPTSFVIHEDIKKMVRFDYLNLLDDKTPQKMDIIFCRNVMIYFDPLTIQRVVKRLEQSLETPGYLFIGHSESLHGLTHELTLRHQQEGIFYQKGDQDSHPARQLVQKRIKKRPQKQLFAIPAKTTESRTIPSLEEQLQEIVAAYHDKNYSQVLRLTKQAHQDYPKAYEPQFYTAQVYVNQRHFELASNILQQLQQQHPMFAQAYYLQGILALEQHDLDQAKKSLKKVLYIDHQFPMAYFFLALTYSQNNDTAAAIHAYRNTLKILMQQEDLTQEVEYSGGFSHETLISICHNSIERLKVKYENCSVHA